MILRPLGRRVARPLSSILGERIGGGFAPAQMFLAGEQGAVFDASDLSRQFQDSAGTTPVTASGQPVGKVLDKSGRNNHIIQASAGNRPILTQDASGFWYWALNGVDAGFQTASPIDFSGTNKICVWAGVMKASDAAAGILCELTADANTTDGGFYLTMPGTAGTNYGFNARGTTAQALRYAGNYAAPHSAVLSAEFDNSQASTATQIVPRVNGATPGVLTDALGPTTNGNFANSALNVGRRNNATVPANGRLYQLIVRGAATTTASRQAAERYVASKMGIVL